MKKAERERRVREVAELLELTPYLNASPASSPADSVSGLRWAARSSVSRAST